MNTRLTPIGILAPLASILLLMAPGPAHVGPVSASELRGATQAELRRWLSHVRPGSPEAIRIVGALDGDSSARTLSPGSPGEFARVLARLRVPADRDHHEYPPGHRASALSRAKRPAGKVDPGWVWRGPGNVAGRSRAVAVDPADPTRQTWWVGTTGGGIWKTTDRGNTWTDAAPDLSYLSISSLVIAPSNPDLMYAGSGEGFYNVDSVDGNGIFKSLDHGSTWTALTSTVDDLRFSSITRMIVDPLDPDVLVVSANTGFWAPVDEAGSYIHRTTDGGITWTTVYSETELDDLLQRPKWITQVTADPSNFDVQFAAIYEKGILKSTDGGQTWSLKPDFIEDFGRYEIAVSTHNPDSVFATAEGAKDELYLSTDAGETWRKTTQSGGTATAWFWNQGWYNNAVACAPSRADVIYVGGIQINRVRLWPNDVRTYAPLAQPDVHVDQHVILPNQLPDGSWYLVNANDGGIAASTNGGGGWTQLDKGMPTANFYGASKRPGRPVYIGGTQDSGSWRSFENPSVADSWFNLYGGDGGEAVWHFDDPRKIISSYSFGGLMRSTDEGLSWSIPPGEPIDWGPFMTKIANHWREPDRLFTINDGGVWRSADFGETWTLSPITTFWTVQPAYADVVVSGADPDVVWAGQAMQADLRLHVSVDGGSTFAPTQAYQGVGLGQISGLATHPTDSQTAFALFSFAGRPKILRTTDRGETWQDLSGFEGSTTGSTNGFPDVAVYDLLAMPHDPDVLWAGTEIGLVESLDGGATWALANAGLPATAIWSIRVVEDEVVLATHGRGVWSVRIPALTSGLVFDPLLDDVWQDSDGELNVSIGVRSDYDQVEVLIDGDSVLTLGSGQFERPITTIRFPVLEADTLTVQLRAMRSGVEYHSVARAAAVVPLNAPVFTYETDFETPADDFVLDGFRIWDPGAYFTDKALHTAHDYQNGRTYTATLKTPIAVAPQNALVSFDEIAVVEPGEDGSTFGDFRFYDYVVVEASRDGRTWIPLGEGYDARAHPEWVDAYEGLAISGPALYRPRSFDLLDVFSPGEQVLLRFRLSTDFSVTSWGWAIDNLSIQPGPTSTRDTPPPAIELAQNHPNPFNPTTTIRYRVGVAGPVSLKIYDLRGRHVRTLVESVQPAGEQTVLWHGRDAAGRPVASGTYIYRLATAGRFLDRKMTLLK